MAPITYLPSTHYQATFRFTGSGLPHGAAIVFGGLIPTTGTPSPSSVGTALKTAWTASGAPYSSTGGFTNTVTFQDILVKFGPFDTGASALTPVGAVIGAQAGDGAVPNTALLVTKYTSLGGHIGRGRIFSPGLSEADIGTGGTIPAGTVTSYQSKFSQVLSAMITATVDMCLLHRYDPDKGETPRLPTPVTSLVVSSLVATQRDRLRR